MPDDSNTNAPESQKGAPPADAGADAGAASGASDLASGAPGGPEAAKGLGALLDRQLEGSRVRAWRTLFLLALLATVLLNFLVPNHHPHFGADRYPLFWAAFGLGAGVVMVFLVKRVIQPLIKRPEDYYGDL
jgi:hypothetical protein